MCAIVAESGLIPSEASSWLVSMVMVSVVVVLKSPEGVSCDVI